MPRLPLAALAAGLLLAGCAVDNDRYESRSTPRYGVYEGGYGGPYYGRSPNYGRSTYYGREPNYWYNRRDNDNNRNRDEARRQPRFDRPENDVVCDRRTQVCYKDKEIDASETREKFGKDAARKVDRVRDRYDNNDIFLPRKNVVCERDDRTCYQNGDPNRKQTREYFGDRAARRVGRNDENR
jgi:hypothetical protein